VQVSGGADHVVVGDAPALNVARYAVVDDVEAQLARFRRGDQRERLQLAEAPPSWSETPLPIGQPWAAAGELGAVDRGRFELTTRLRTAGAGIVYGAVDHGSGQPVTVKLLDQRLSGDPSVRARFERECELARVLAHPSLVRVISVFAEPDGRLGIAMEPVEGASLSEVLAWSRVPAQEAVRIALALLDLLAYLAAQGLARADLTPGDVVIAADRTPILRDFGLLRRAGEPGFEPTQALTMVGAPIGTPRYAAPEQLRGGQVDIRADLYTLGLILLELLTGKPARPEDNVLQVMHRAITEDVNLSGLRCSAELRAVLEGSLRRQPEQRFATPHSMRDALLGVPEAQPGAAPLVFPEG
jgi:serine/threonine-protein kinase